MQDIEGQQSYRNIYSTSSVYRQLWNRKDNNILANKLDNVLVWIYNSVYMKSEFTT